MATTTAQSVQGFYQNILRRTGSAADVTFWSNTVDVQGVPLSQVQNEFVTSSESMTFVLPIVQIYQTYLGRAPDSAGLTAWVKAFEAGTSLSTIQSDFANSAESAKFYGGSISTPANSAFVTQLYQTVLNRGPTPAEVTAVLAATTDRATLLADFMASPEAQVTLTNASNQFLNTIGSGSTNPYGVPLFNGGGIASNVFTLTPGADLIPNGLVGSNGTTNNGNVSINGAVDPGNPASNTLNASDNLNGGSGANTINVTYSNLAAGNQDATAGALISNVQTFNARNATLPAVGSTAALDASNIAGLTAFNSNLGVGAASVVNLAAGASAGVIGNGTVHNGDLTVGYVATATAATINFTGGTGNAVDKFGPTVHVNGAAVTSTTVNSTGAANTVNQLFIPGTSKTLAVDADTNLKLLVGVVGAALTGITASGAAPSVNLGSLFGDPVKTIDASGLTGGGISVKDVGSTTTAFTTFTGGAGNDTLIFAAAVPGGATGITGTQTLNGGTGTNILGTAEAGVLPTATYTGINASTNFQTLELTGAAPTLDQSKVTNTAFTTVEFNSAGMAPIVNNATTAVNYSIVVAGNVTLDAAVGQSVVNASLDGSSTAPATAFAIGEHGAQTFNLASNGSFTTANSVGPLPLPIPAGTISFHLDDNTLFNITGSQALTTGAIQDTGAGAPPAGPVGETINAGTFAGKLTLDNTAGSNKAVFTTGTGGSAMTAATGAGVINNFTLGTGADKLSFLGGSSAITAGPTTLDTVTSFDATKDSFALGFVPTAVSTASGAGGGLDLLTDLNAAIGVSKIAAGHAEVVTLTGGTDAGTYLASNATAAPASVAVGDTVLHLAGLTGTLGTGNFA